MIQKAIFSIVCPAFVGLSVLLLASCSPGIDRSSVMTVSVKDQTMLLSQKGKPVKTYKVSTSKFGLGDRRRSNRTPLGTMVVAEKIGDGAPLGAVFKSRKRTGEVLKPNAPGRDPIVTRIMWLKGAERRNRNAYGRYIYIHGTPEERFIGQPMSYGCIRMKSRDVIDLYKRIGVGARIKVVPGHLIETEAGREYTRTLYKRGNYHSAG